MVGKANRVISEITASYRKRVVFTTAESDTYVLIQASKTKKPFLQVVEGEIDDFTMDSYGDKYVLRYIKKDLNIMYKSSNTYNITFGDYCIRLFYTESVAADQYNWNIGNITYNGNIVVPSGTDIVGPIRISGDSDFISGIHGSSTTTKLKVICDNEEVTLSDALNKDCNKITIYMIDECRSQATLAHVFDRYVTIEITKNKIHITNTFKCVSDSAVTVQRATNGGLIAVRNNILLSASMNNYIMSEPSNTSIGNRSNKNIHATLNTIYGSITVDNILGHEREDYSGFFGVFTNENPIRTKTYFDILTKSRSISNGDLLCGEFEYNFYPV